MEISIHDVVSALKATGLRWMTARGIAREMPKQASIQDIGSYYGTATVLNVVQFIQS